MLAVKVIMEQVGVRVLDTDWLIWDGETEGVEVYETIPERVALCAEVREVVEEEESVEQALGVEDIEEVALDEYEVE